MSTKTGVFITNLGTPTAPTTPAVRTYLAEFLSDPRVIDKPRWFWLPILYGIILRIRPARSAKAYQEVWTEQGSPLLNITQDQATALQEQLGDDFVVSMGMRYGEPSIKTGLLKFREHRCEKIIVIPLYPQFAAATTASTFDAIAAALKPCPNLPTLTFLRSYHDHPLYINALAHSVEHYWQHHERGECLLLSFHGLPQRYVDNGDPYYDHCQITARLLAEKLNLTDAQWKVTFQSRVGPEPWLQPYTDKTLQALPSQGIKKIDVMCPGFSADCLETLEEIDMQNREFFTEAGGEQFQYIPCLNASDEHIKLMVQLVHDHQ